MTSGSGRLVLHDQQSTKANTLLMRCKIGKRKKNEWLWVVRVFWSLIQCVPNTTPVMTLLSTIPQDHSPLLPHLILSRIVPWHCTHYQTTLALYLEVTTGRIGSRHTFMKLCSTQTRHVSWIGQNTQPDTTRL